ncbi:MAG TPA: efflux transporter outer membrane subunit [Longimicrobiales bacterium]|nr:efflux transporter outer membrane subunit [Longimicrobiales bacterium]
MRARTAAAQFSLCLLVAACGLPPGADVVVPTDSLPTVYPVTEAPEAPDTEAVFRGADTGWAEAWWRDFDDPVLDSLLDIALSENLDIAEAVARVEEAQARLGVATAGLLPTLNGSGNASRNEQPANAGIVGGLFGGGNDSVPSDSTTAPDSTSQARPDRFAFTDYTVSLSMSYELDLWGRIRRDRAAALADLVATADDFRGVRIGVISETIRAYHEVLDLDRRVEYTEEIVDVLEERAALAETRYGQGLVSSFELYQIRGQLRAAATSLPQLTAQLADARRRLDLLTGGFPGELDELLGGAAPPDEALDVAPPPAGVPADVLVQRPDVRAAARRLEAARLRVGARKAELLPGITLSGTVGLQASEPDNLFRLDQWFNNLAAGLTAPLFQGGRLRANVSVAEAQYAARVAAYRRSVLTAIGEVEATLRQYGDQRERFETISGQLSEAEASLEVQSDRYAGGVGGYTDYLDALRNALDVRASVATARRDLALARLAVHRALGGTWVHEDEDSPSSIEP